MAITNPAVALAVINEAKTHGVFNGNIPETEDAKVAQANELLKLAEQAKEAGVQAAAVVAVINAAQQEAGASSVAPNPFGAAAPAAAPAPPAAAPVAAAPPVAPAAPVAAAAFDPNTLIPNYDDAGKAEIVAALETLTDEQIAAVKAYEAENDERGFIEKFVRSTPAPAAAAPVPAAAAPAAAVAVEYASVDEAQYTTVEPWTGYSKAKIPDIEEQLAAAIGTHPEPNKLFAHVWAFEEANKDRARLKKKLTDIATNGVPNTPAAPAAPAPAAAPEPAGVVAQAPFAQQLDPTAAAAVAAAPAPAAAPSTEFPAGIAAPLSGATQKAAALIGQEFPVIPAVSGVPNIPEDFTVLSDVEVRQYASKFNAVQARLLVLLALAEGHASDAKIAGDNAVDQFIRSNGDPKATVKSLEAGAGELTEVATARHTQHEWSEVARQYRALVSIYDTTCKRLSREQTGREEEKANVR